MTTAFGPRTRSRVAAACTTTALAAALTLGAAGPVFAIAPTATADFYAVTAGAPLTVSAAEGILANDTDPENDPVSIHSLWSNGAALPGEELVTNADGSFTYYPPTGYTGTREWLYRAQDATDVSPVVAITFTITAPVAATAPVAVADAFAVTPGMPLAVAAPGLYANDYDADGDSWSYKFVMQPVGNALPGESLDISVGYGAFVYTPPTGFTGVRTWQYSIQGDDGESELVDIVFTIGSPAPVNTAPVSQPDAYSVMSGAVLTVAADGVLDNDSDADGDALTAGSATGPAVVLAGESLTLNPDGSLVYVPPTGFTGTRTWSYVANDGTTDGAPASIVFTVNAVPNQVPVAAADAFDVVADTDLVVGAPGVLANDTDADGDAVTAGWTGEPAGGVLPGEKWTLQPDGSFVYTPPTGYTGTRTWSYEVFDGTTDSPFAPVTFTIAGPMLPTLPEPTSPSTPAGGASGASLASTGVDGAGLAGTAALSGLLVAGGLLARRFSRREA